MTLQHNVYGQDHKVKIICEEGYEPQTDSLTCLEGKWSSNGIPLETICEREPFFILILSNVDIYLEITRWSLILYIFSCSDFHAMPTPTKG